MAKRNKPQVSYNEEALENLVRSCSKNNDNIFVLYDIDGNKGAAYSTNEDHTLIQMFCDMIVEATLSNEEKRAMPLASFLTALKISIVHGSDKVAKKLIGVLAKTFGLDIIKLLGEVAVKDALESADEEDEEESKPFDSECVKCEKFAACVADALDEMGYDMRNKPHKKHKK